MDKAEAKKRIVKLRKVINHHRYLYHVLDKPEISDAASDSLKHELFQLEEKFPDLITPDSPTQRIGGKPLDKFVKVRHKKPMLSLQDAFSEEEIKDWQKRLQKLVPWEKLDYFAELKIDGFAVSLTYDNGIFSKGATRGDGKTGEDVTQNLKTIESIPLRLNKEMGKKEIEIRGEVYMSSSIFEKINQERKRKGLSLYANPRNTAAGSIRQLNPKIAATRQLDFLAYDIVTDLGLETHHQEHQTARSLGFKSDRGEYCPHLKEVFKFFKEIDQKREKLEYQIDGIVVRINNNKIFEKLGVVGKAPRGAIAFKFPAEETTTIIKDIIIQIGRTGALTPVARLKPVRVGGALISRATLHNEDEIKRLDVRIGDTVIIQRAGDVIPDVVKVLKEMRTGRENKFQMPKKCPICGGKVVRPKGEAVHRCVNKKCALIQRRQIAHFVSKNAFNIEGLGPQIINQLMDEGLINNVSDIFTLTEGDIIPLERFEQKSAANLITAINQSKKIILSRFINALGIRHIGEETAINLARYFGSLKKLEKAKQDQLYRVKDIGQVVAQSAFKWFNSIDNQNLVDKLIENGVKIEKQKTIKKKLTGQTFVLTGHLDKFTRDQAKEKIRDLGGDISSLVSKETDFLIIGKEPGSKYDRAKRLGIRMLSEKEFLRLISG
ncbi:MAG: NAD-dependent DNA ligase LigA [Candidatus Portnoybacteria bacterium]